MHNLNHVERIARCDGVDEDIAVYPDGVLGVDRREFILCHEDEQFEGKFEMKGLVWTANRRADTHLTSRVNDMTIIFDALVHHTFSESRLDCWVIGVHEVVLHGTVSIRCQQMSGSPHLDELFYQRRLACRNQVLVERFNG